MWENDLTDSVLAAPACSQPLVGSPCPQEYAAHGHVCHPHRGSPPGGHEYPVALLRWTAAGEELRANATLPESLQPGGFANPFTLDEILAAYAGAAGAEPLLARAGQ